MAERKAFLAKPKHQYHVSLCEEPDYSAITKWMGIITSIQVYIISWMDFDSKENGGEKSFSSKSKESMPCTPMWRT